MLRRTFVVAGLCTVAVPAEVATAAREASVEACHLAALVSAGLLVAGSLVNGVGLKTGSAAGAAASVRDDRTAAGDPTRAGAAPD